MRKNDVRKWIHATLDLLPLLVIPIFALAVRSDNNFEPISITTEGYDIVDKYQSNEVNSLDDIKDNNIYLVTENFSFGGSSTYNFSLFIVEGNIYATSYDYSFEFDDYITANSTVGYSGDSGSSYFNIMGGFVQIDEFIVTTGCIIYIDGVDNFLANYNAEEGFSFPYNKLQYTDYNEKIVIYNEGKVYNDTDVGSQLVYTLYRTVDNYFNFNNVFNFNQIYDWLTVNIFGGNPPLSAFIVWNIFLYEFLMDLIFLLYALFMFFIDMCTNLIDRFTCSASGRSLK